MRRTIMLILGVLTLLFSILEAQISEAEKRTISIGSLQSHFTAWGSERAWNGSYYEGLRWPADYPEQDNSVIKRAWLATQDFTDEAGMYHDNFSIYFNLSRVAIDQFPIELTQTAKYPEPTIYVNGITGSYLDHDYIDAYDPNQIPDRIITNVVNTSLGLTQTREILAFSQQNHDNYFIKIFTFTNTGNTDYDADIELTDSLHGVRIGWGTRYSCGRSGAWDTGNMWGAHNWVTRRGEDYPQHYLDPITPENPIAEWLRCGFSWMGQASQLVYDNVGAPNLLGDGSLLSPKFVGSVVLHVDVGANDPTDNIFQPTFLGWQAGDLYPNPDDHAATYYFLAGNPYPDASAGGSDRMDDRLESITHRLDPYTIHGDAGGTNIMISYGPFDLAHGESITIVEAEGVNGINQEMCQQIGNRWKSAYLNPGDTGPFPLPDNSETNDEDIYKNSWVYTGMDSIMLTFTRAKQNFDSNFQIPQPPPPPMLFDLYAAGGQVNLIWDNTAESFPGFGGYRVYRNHASYYGTFQEIFACGAGTDHPEVEHGYVDMNVQDSIDYYYYLVSFSEDNFLESGKFYTLTTLPVNLLEVPLVDADLFVNPNGNDENSGLSADDPLKTISRALQRILHSELHPNTIHLAQGIYSSSSNGEIFPLHIDNYLEVSGEVGTILDAENSSRILTIAGENITLNNLQLVNGLANSELARGGGILAQNTSLVLNNISISHCSANNGGGMWAFGSNLYFSGVTISANHAEFHGGGLHLGLIGSLGFNELNPTSIYHNTAGEVGFDLYDFLWSDSVRYQMSLDTFTVSSPSDYHVFPTAAFNLDINTGLETQYAADLYVSPVGDDSNTGLVSTEPLQTISKAIQTIITDSMQTYAIHLEEGLYSLGNSGEHLPLYLRDYLTISGTSPATAVLDGEYNSALITAHAHAGVTIKNLGLKHGLRATPGTAILVSHSNLDLTNLVIENNNGPGRSAALGLSNESFCNLAAVTIRNNTGGGIHLQGNSNINFDPVNRCNIYFNSSSPPVGQEIFASDLLAPVALVLDTFTVLYPIEEYVSPLSDFTFDIQNSIIYQEEADLFISPLGSNENSGLTAEDPLKTIAFANELIFADETRPHTINLLEGVYSASSNGESLPIQMRSFVSLAGHPDGGSIIDAEHLGQGLICDNVTDLTVSNLTVRGGSTDDGAGIYCIDSYDIDLANVIIQDNRVGSYGGGIYAENSSINIEDAVFMENRAKYGAGIAMIGSELNVTGSLFYDDSAKYGAALYLKGSNAQLDQLTITDNEVSRRGAAIALWQSGTTILSNSIGWNNGDLSLYLRTGTDLSVEYSNIQGGMETVSGDSIYWLDGNIDLDPLFCHPVGANYHLAENSPCVAAGENGENMGALEVGCTVTVDDYALLPTEHTLYQNFPNPFNPVTTIRYGLMENARVNLVIYDITGRTVVSLEDREQVAGWYDLTWNGIDQVGHPMSTGVYFCRLQVKDLAQCGTGDYSKTIKMIYLK